MRFHSWDLVFEPRDLWLGVYWRRENTMMGQVIALYICFLPTLPLILRFEKDNESLLRKAFLWLLRKFGSLDEIQEALAETRGKYLTPSTYAVIEGIDLDRARIILDRATDAGLLETRWLCENHGLIFRKGDSGSHQHQCIEIYIAPPAEEGAPRG